MSLEGLAMGYSGLNQGMIYEELLVIWFKLGDGLVTEASENED